MVVWIEHYHHSKKIGGFNLNFSISISGSQMCRKPSIHVSIFRFQFPVLGCKSGYLLHAADRICQHEIEFTLPVHTVDTGCRNCLPKLGGKWLSKSQVEHGGRLHLPDINTVNINGWSSIVEEVHMCVRIVGYSRVCPHVDCHSASLYKGLNHRFIHL